MFLKKCLSSISYCAETAQSFIQPLRPLKSISEIALGALSFLSIPFTGSIGLINGVAGLSNGSINVAQDLLKAGTTIKKIVKAESIEKKEIAQLAVSAGVVSLVTFAVFNPAAALIAAKTGAVALSKSLLAGLALI